MKWPFKLYNAHRSQTNTRSNTMQHGDKGGQSAKLCSDQLRHRKPQCAPFPSPNVAGH